MRIRYLLTICVAVALLALFTHHAPTTHAQRNAIDTYAITNARIVPVSGPEIARGTIVIRNGLITAVGANVSAPADARIIDGTGLTVYPGLIDANTTLGMPQPSPSPSASPGRSGAGLPTINAPPQPTFFTAPNSAQPPGLQPEVLAENIIQTGGDQIDAERNAGITAALTAPREGIFIGQSAFINLAGDTPRQMIVRSPIALHIGFTPLRAGTYPGSLMGVFSAIRQMLLDAQRYRESHVTYEQNPRGLRRPTQDRSLAALIPGISREMPVVMQANTEREIRRALDLAQEFNLRLIISGGAESWKVVDRLREMNVPVLLSLNFPRRTTAQVAEADPEPLRVLRERIEAPKAAGRLAAARVRFAFQSGSMSDLKDFLANAAKAVENGLARDEALRAMTINAAEILGVANQLGSIEVGKIANLTVTRGDIFDRNARITNVFIDGRPVDLKPQTTTARGAGASGTWTVNIKLEGKDITITLILQQEGENLRGSIQGELGSGQIASASIGATGDLRITVPVTYEGQTHEATFSGKITGNEMSGSVSIVGITPGTFTGSRAGGSPTATPSATPSAQPSPTPEQPSGNPPSNSTDVSGTYNLTLTVGPNTVNGTLLLRQQGQALSGTLQTPFGKIELSDGSISADGFRFTTAAEVEGRTVEMTMTGIVKGNEISGTVNSEIGSTVFTGTRAPKMSLESGVASLESNVKSSSHSFDSRLQTSDSRLPPGETLIRNATILTVSKGTLQNSDILIRRGKIAAIGQNLKAGANARVIDATGKYVMPGIIDCHSHTMIDAINEGTVSVSSMVNVKDVLNPTDIAIYRELAGGTTTANILHGSANSIGGQTIVVKLKYGRPASDFIFPGALPGIKFALGENPKRTNFQPQPGQQRRYPATRMGVEETIRDAFTRARDYKKDWDEYRAAVKRGEKNLIPPRRDLQLEPLVEVLEGKRYLHSHCYRADEILMLINIANEFGFKVRTFQHVLEGYKVAREIAEHGAGGSTFSDWWGYKIEAYDATPYNTAIMMRAGVVVSVNSDSNELARRLNIEAAKMMKYGDLTEEEALKLITLNPAIQLGIQDRVGTIDVGKDADVVIWSGHPLSTYSRVETTFIDGDIFFDRQQDLARRTDLERERAQLEQAEQNRPPAQGGTSPPAPRRRPSHETDDEWDGGNDQR